MKMMLLVKDILNYINQLYPLVNSHSFDNGKVGLQFGNPDKVVNKIMLCLDTTEEVIDKAIKEHVNLIISHHPFMFSPLLNLDYRTNFGRKLQKVIKNDINIMAFHTNFDVGLDGMNDVLAKKLELSNIHFLTEEICQDSLIRVGNVKPMKLLEFCYYVKEKFEIDNLRVVGNLDKVIETVSIVGGSGSSEFNDALRVSDVFITGQIPHHLGIEAIENDFCLIEVSHAIEFYGLKMIKSKLEEKFNVEIEISTTNFDPFKTI